MDSKASYHKLPPLPSATFDGIKIMLASNSPRRRELLGMIVPEFTIAPSRDIDEAYPSDLAPEKVPEYLSRLKADAYADMLSADTLVVTADTVVILNDRILGKPKGCDDAVAMLLALSEREHTVVTGVTLSSLGGRRTDTFSVKTRVKFAEIVDKEIAEYVTRYEPYDKAGAYGIQEWIGAAAIEGIEGSFYNVMGLPLHALYMHLKHFYD